jgi:aryl-alcohol dehydrogenase-like predicted oxidoreductase
MYVCVTAGNWLSKKGNAFRSKLLIATKVWGSMDPTDVNAMGLSRLHIMSAVEASLRRLQTSYIDLYQVIM